MHTISFEDNPATFRCRSDQAVLVAMCATADRCIPVGCRSGGCGVCRVAVLSGEYDTGAMSAAHIGAAERARGEVLSCQLLPRSDLHLRILGPRRSANENPYQKFMERLREQQAWSE